MTSRHWLNGARRFETWVFSYQVTHRRIPDERNPQNKTALQTSVQFSNTNFLLNPISSFQTKHIENTAFFSCTYIKEWTYIITGQAKLWRPNTQNPSTWVVSHAPFRFNAASPAQSRWSLHGLVSEHAPQPPLPANCEGQNSTHARDGEAMHVATKYQLWWINNTTAAPWSRTPGVSPATQIRQYVSFPQLLLCTIT